jgi:sugar lactone lactonase YvrE
MIVGQGDFRYQVADGWEQLPEGWRHGDVAGVATDSQDRVYVFNRGEHPLLIYDRDGRFLSHWGEGVFTRPHGITIQDDILYLADDSDHTVRKFTLEGKLLQTLGKENQPSETGYVNRRGPNLTTIERGAEPFNRPTRLRVAPSGEMYVSDGYGNARVHRFTAAGELIQSWGEPGIEPGQFNLPHSVWVHTDGRVFVCDRENDRIQIFSREGEFLDAWPCRRPGDLYIDADANVYVGEMFYQKGSMSLAGRTWTEDQPAQMTVRDITGKVICRFGEAGDPCAEGNLVSPHGIWVDSRGDIYVGEVTQTSLGNRGWAYTEDAPSVRKFIRVG